MEPHDSGTSRNPAEADLPNKLEPEPLDCFKKSRSHLQELGKGTSLATGTNWREIAAVTLVSVAQVPRCIPMKR